MRSWRFRATDRAFYDNGAIVRRAPLAATPPRANYGAMDIDDEFTSADRAMTIGVLATLAAHFLANSEDGALDVMERYRRDLSRQLGHLATDDECFDSIDAQIVRLRRSIGEPG